MNDMILNKIINNDCMSGMKEMADKSVDFTLTDIPYNAVNRKSNGLRELDKEFADEKSRIIFINNYFSMCSCIGWML